jgi:Tol biopolymer transport system component
VTDNTQYNLAAIRKLLLAAFAPEDLHRFCQDSRFLSPVVAKFGPGHGLDDMVDEVIDYCQTRLLWDELLAAIKEANPRQYTRFEPYARASQSPLSRHLSRTKARLELRQSPGMWIMAAMAGALVLLLGMFLVMTFGPWVDDETPVPSPTTAIVFESPTSMPTTPSPTSTPPPINTSPPTSTPLPPTPTPDGGGTGSIAFMSDRDGNQELYLMDKDSGDVERLTNNAAKDVALSWSPDGRVLAFSSERDGNWDIFVLNVESREIEKLTANESADADPDWSPNGLKIAFESYRDGNGEIYVMNADGSGAQNLTQATSQEWGPTWSPDSQRIGYVSNRDGNNEIYVMNADGTNQTRLTRNAAWDGVPAWSPDGKWIAFVSERSGDRSLHLMSPSGDDVKWLANATLYAYPGWSPDSRQIAYAFEFGRHHEYQIYIIDVESGAVKELTNRSGVDSYPAWQPSASP